MNSRYRNSSAKSFLIASFLYNSSPSALTTIITERTPATNMPFYERRCLRTHRETPPSRMSSEFSTIPTAESQFESLGPSASLRVAWEVIFRYVIGLRDAIVRQKGNNMFRAFSLLRPRSSFSHHSSRCSGLSPNVRPRMRLGHLKHRIWRSPADARQDIKGYQLRPLPYFKHLELSATRGHTVSNVNSWAWWYSLQSTPFSFAHAMFHHGSDNSQSTDKIAATKFPVYHGCVQVLLRSLPVSYREDQENLLSARVVACPSTWAAGEYSEYNQFHTGYQNLEKPGFMKMAWVEIEANTNYCCTNVKAKNFCKTFYYFGNLSIGFDHPFWQ